MRLSSYALALVVAAPAVAWSQGGADTKLPFETMQANVAKIVAPQEKERWQANVAIWQLKLDRAGAMEKADLDKARASLDIINANIARITAVEEKERWQANRDLWEIVLSKGDKFTPADREKIKAAYDKMNMNIARISEPSEKERWHTNRQLWQATINGL
jgi:hypothetical protein